MAKCPNCGAELKKQDDNVYVCEQCNVGFTLNKIEPSQQQSASNTSEETKIKELEARLAMLEAEKQSKHKASEFFAKFAIAKDGKLALFFKKYWVILLVGVLLFVAFLTLMITLVGLRGIYVNVNDPNDFYDFDATSYRASSGDFLTGEETLEEGKWKLKGDKLVLTTNDEFFGKISDDFDFEKLDGFKRIKIDGMEYKRVSLVGLKTTQQKVKITFDPQNGDSSVVKKVNIGKKMQGEIADPQRFDGVFLGWFSEKGGNGKQFDPTDLVWENTTYYAHWYIEYDVSSDGVLYGFYGDGSRLGDDITLPSYVTSINFGAFAGNTNIREITIPDSVTSIGSGAFEGCTGLQTVNIGNGVTNIAYDAFRGCTNIETATLPAIAIDCIPKDNLNTVTITSGKIPRNAFDGCTGLQTVTIGSGVTSIGDYAFDGCTGLSEITISDSTTSIGEWAFRSCTGLQVVTMSRVVTSIGYSAFSGCTGITRVNYLGNLKSWCKIKFGGYAANPLYNGNAKLYVQEDGEEKEVAGDINIPDGTTKIGDSAFYGLKGITAVTIPDSVTSIDDAAFLGCTGLNTVTIGDGVESIGESAFSGCTGLQTATIPDSVTSIGDKAFYNCTSLQTVTIGDGVESIGESEFSGCRGLQTVTIGDSVTSISRYAFSGCTGITRVNYLGDLKGWCEIEFENASANPLYNGSAELYVKENDEEKEVAGDVNIPVGTTKIEYYAFYGLTGLTSVNIPDSVTSIGDNAFYNCTGITRVNYLGDLKGWCEIEFGNEYANPLNGGNAKLYVKENGEEKEVTGEINIPDGLTEIGNYVFFGLTGITSVNIPDNVTSIGEYAFYGCTGLQTVTIGSGVTRIENYAFSGCTGITKVVAYSLKDWCEIDFGGYYANPLHSNAKLYVKENGEEKEVAGEVIITTDINYIGGYAFCGYRNITSVIISDSVQVVNWFAFAYCTNLQTVTIGKSLIGTGSGIFDSCSSLRTVNWNATNCVDAFDIFRNCHYINTVNIGENVTSIGESAFSGCTGITKVNYLGDLKGWCEIEFGSGYANPLYDANNAKLYVQENGGEKEVAGEVNIPDGITKIGAYVFDGLKGITSVTIPESVTSIGGSAFSGCTGLQTVTIPDSVTSIGGFAFDGCTGLQTVTIPESVTSIGNSAFRDCTGLQTVTIPDSVTSIGGFAFDGCTGLQTVTIGSGFTSIGEWAFTNCTGLKAFTVAEGNSVYQSKDGVVYIKKDKSIYCVPYAIEGAVTILDGCTSIGDHAFDGRTGLSEITIPDSVISIGEYAFYGCTGLQTATIGAGVTSIDDYAFFGCENLKDIYYAGDETQWGQITKAYSWDYGLSYQMHYNSTGPEAAAVSGGEATRYEGQESYAEVRMPEAWAESLDERRIQAA